MHTPSRSDQPSITYRFKRGRGEPYGSVYKVYFPTVSDKNKQNRAIPGPKSREVLSRTKLISAVAQICDTLGTLPISQPNAKLNHHQQCVSLGDVLEVKVGTAPTGDDDGKCFYIDTTTSSLIKPMGQPKLEFLKATMKVSLFDPCSENRMLSLFYRVSNGGTDLPNESRKVKAISSIRNSYELEKLYGWMKEIIPAGSLYTLNGTDSENKITSKSCNLESTICNREARSSVDIIHPADSVAFRTDNGCSKVDVAQDASLCDSRESTSNTGTDSFLHSALQDSNLNSSVSNVRNPSLCADYCINSIVPSNGIHEKLQHTSNTGKVTENMRKPPQKIVIEDKNGKEINTSEHQRPSRTLARPEHAFAGAFAGIFVSLCLHPVDTIKTVIQSCRAEQKSVLHIGKSIVSERGVTGLYRGFASNIASSAPISAIYTFTYESVKGSLIPIFTKEYHSFAHCIAGGCASIGTSFVFTPSEHIKQQMQVGSHYNNCWSALVGVLRTGGWLSLYTGWGAVLCRNVPHSIIKFYTYESLKQLTLSSKSSRAQPNTSQTLVCGGLAGSTAALFTTPFDVVKTRLQTQFPGSRSQYHGVFHALQVIGKNEGLKGLYRGLVPRLLMYMSQGALFFASYESLKRLFSLGVNAQRIEYKDDSMPLRSPS